MPLSSRPLGQQPGPVLSVLLFVLVATGSPGGATALAAASGARFGVRRSLPLMLGIATGLATLAAVAALGLAGVLFEVPYAELVVRVLGTAYLLRLAWQTARSGAPGDASLSRPRTFGAGVLLLWLNPKGWAMTLSATAAFASVVDGTVRLGLLLGTAFGVGATVSQLLWCALGGVLGRVLTDAWHWRALNVALAVLLVASVAPLWLDAP